MATRHVRLAVLDTYAVRWDRATFVRDLLQNFFDATPDFRQVRIDIDRSRGRVEVSGPTTFDLELLNYIGATTKLDGTTAGAFGEGFKICALVGVRDFGLVMTAGSGALDLQVVLEPVAIGEAQGRELCYAVSERSEPYPGSYVHLTGCDADMLDRFEQGRACFRYHGNPKLLVPIAEAAVAGVPGAVAVYPGPSAKRGEIYYRRQLRGEIRYWGRDDDPALTLVYDPPIAAFDGDRDRRDLPARPIAQAIGMLLSPEDLTAVFHHLMPAWEHGHEVLYGFIDAAVERKLQLSWPDRWLARSDERGLVSLAERQGFRLAIASFAAIGMKTAGDRFTGNLATRPATALETARLEVLADLYAGLYGELPKTTRFEVFDDASHAAIRGQHLGDRVLVGAEAIAEGFDAVAATALHEFSHEAGGEEAPAFLARLERLLSAAIRRPELIERARARYAVVTEADVRPPPTPPPVIEAYDPMAPFREQLSDDDGVVCMVFAPEAFPPVADIAAAVATASARAEVSVFLAHVQVDGEQAAVRDRLPGVPTLWVSGRDVVPSSDAPAYRLRTYNGALCPDPELIYAALMESKANGWMGRPSMLRVREARGPVASTGPSPRELKADEIRSALAAKYGGSYAFYLPKLWSEGIGFAAHALALECADDPRPAAELIELADQRLLAAIQRARELRRADPDFDDADDFERAAMAAAQGAFVAACIAAPTPGFETGERVFFEVRRITALVIDLAVDVYLKVQVVGRVVKAGFGSYSLLTYRLAPGRPSFVPEALGPAYEAAAAWALDEQVSLEERGRMHRRMRADRIHLLPESTRDDTDYEAQRRRRAERTQAVRRVFDDILATTGDRLLAAERCLAAATQNAEANPS